MRRFAGLVALLVVLAACGGTDWNSAGGPGAATAKSTKTARSKSTKKAAAAAAVASATEKPYVDAMVTSALANPDSSGVGATVYRCVDTALVHGFGTKTFSSSGLSPNALRSPDVSLDGLPDPTDEQIESIGAALQRCGLGKAISGAMLSELGAGAGADHTRATCVGNRIDTDPRARRFAVTFVLERDIDQGSAHAMVLVLAACLDLPALVLDAAHVNVDAATRACILRQLRNSQDALMDSIALAISGSDPQTAVERNEELAVAVNHCKPQRGSGFTVPSG